MRASFCLGLIGCLLAGPFTISAASAPKLQPITFAGKTYIDLRSWGQQFQFVTTFDRKTGEIALSNRWTTLKFEVDSKRMFIGGVSVYLSHPVAAKQNAALIAYKDIQRTLDPILFTRPRPQGKKIQTIAIAAGHGGKDPGNMVGTHKEKNYTLLLAQELEKIVEKAGMRALMTRRKDEFVSLEGQVEHARKVKADLLLILHFNSASAAQVGGLETYCFSPTGTASTNGGDELASSFKGNAHDDQNILLAYQVHRSLVRSLDFPDRGVRRARFQVLRDARMPAVLIEGGFMTNPSDARKIYDPVRRQEMARAILDGVLAFKRTTERPAPKKPVTSK